MRSSVLTTTVLGLALGPAVLVATGGAADAATPRCAGERATIVGTSGADRLRGTPGRDVVLGRGGADRIVGLGGDDVLCGGRGRDDVRGGDGDDTLRGGAGSNRLAGGAGSDRLVSGPRGGGGRTLVQDLVLGGPGDDRVLSRGDALTTVSYAAASGGALVDLETGHGTAPGLGRDRLVDVSGVLGSRFDDTLTGSDRDDSIDGRRGVDEILGAGGTDFLVGGPGVDVARGGDGFDILIGMSGDRLYGDRGGDIVASVGAVSRTIDVDLGPGADVALAYGGLLDLAGGGGPDTLALPDFTSLEGGPVPGVGSIDLTLGTASYDDADFQVRAMLSGVESGFGSSGDDVLIGDDAANLLFAGAGDDDVRGMAGDDELLGRGGVDRLDGGTGTDVCRDAGATTVRIDCEPSASPRARASADAGPDLRERVRTVLRERVAAYLSRG